MAYGEKADIQQLVYRTGNAYIYGVFPAPHGDLPVFQPDDMGF